MDPRSPRDQPDVRPRAVATDQLTELAIPAVLRAQLAADAWHLLDPVMGFDTPAGEVVVALASVTVVGQNEPTLTPILFDPATFAALPTVASVLNAAASFAATWADGLDPAAATDDHPDKDEGR